MGILAWSARLFDTTSTSANHAKPNAATRNKLRATPIAVVVSVADSLAASCIPQNSLASWSWYLSRDPSAREGMHWSNWASTDHRLLPRSIADRFAAADVDREAREWERASDYAPT
jgi:hypothetical protein